MSLNPHPHIPPSAGPAAEALQHAEQTLADALIAGDDTAPARAALEAARAVIDTERDAVDLAAREAASAHDAAARQVEADAVAETHQQVGEALATIESAPGAETLPEPVESPAVASAVLRVEQVRRALQQAQVPHHAAIAERGALRTRLKGKEAELGAIRTRRAAGDEQAGDAATMSALAMDIEDLTRMLVPLDAAVVSTSPAAQQQALAEAESALTAARRNAEVTGMADRVRLLEAHFIDAVRTLRLEAQKRGQHNLGSIYQPADNLRRLSRGEWI